MQEKDRQNPGLTPVISARSNEVGADPEHAVSRELSSNEVEQLCKTTKPETFPHPNIKFKNFPVDFVRECQDKGVKFRIAQNLDGTFKIHIA